MLEMKLDLCLTSQKNSLYQGLILHICCVEISTQLREIYDKEKQQFLPDSLPLTRCVHLGSTHVVTALVRFGKWHFLILITRA